MPKTTGLTLATACQASKIATKRSAWAPGVAFLAGIFVVTGFLGCGGEDIDWGGGGGDDAEVTFVGNLDSVSPVTSRDIVVFVYEIDEDDAGDEGRCPCPPDPSSSASGKAAIISSGETEFQLSGLTAGTFGVVFLLENAGDAADGEINPGDPIAILDDVDCDLNNLSGTKTVTLEDIDLHFSAAPESECEDGVDDPPAAGRARAEAISVSTTSESTSD